VTAPALPPRWSDERFDRDLMRAVEVFRTVRMREPLEQYLRAYDECRLAVDALLDRTSDLSEILDRAVEIVADAHLLEAVRYLASPAVSEDDLRVLADAALSAGRLRADPDMARRVVRTVLQVLDRNRFPWMATGRRPTDSERETAVVATSALIASRRVLTARANGSKDEQEKAVADYLVKEGYSEVDRRTVHNNTQAPRAGEFCRESHFGARKADLIVGLWDGRSMPIECKVSNSSTNSVKRVNNDVAAKAATWLASFGPNNCVPVAILSGVFKLHNLRAAQEAGLTIFWSHDLAAMAEFIAATRA
jgi:KaiC/GvpD/RAD55 family RecA-like ATPase